MLTRRQLQLTILTVFGILVLINVLGEEFYLRMDLTADKRYTLSDATLDILKNLEEPVTITAYFTSPEKLPPQIAQVKNEFMDLLIEYSNRSDGMVVYEFIDPNKDAETEQQAQMQGIQPMLVNTREKDQIKQVKAYMGAVVQSGDQTEVIPIIRPNAALEYTLSSAIKKVTIKEKPLIGFVQGHGEPKLTAMRQAENVLSVLYTVKEVKLDTTINPAEYKALAIVAPKDSFPARHLQVLDDYLAEGGRLLLAVNRVESDIQKGFGGPVNTGLEKWLEQKGVLIEDKYLVDANCATVTVTQQQGFFTIQTPVQFPFLPIIRHFADHPITKGLEAVIFPFVSPLTYAPADSAIQFTYLARSSNKSGTMGPSVFFDYTRNWTAEDFPLSRLPVAVAIEGKIAGEAQAKMVVFGDGDFAVNGEGRAAQQLQPDNVSLFVNAIDWLSDDTGLVGLRTKAITSRPLKDDIDDSKKALIKWLNFLLPIGLIIIYGIGRYQYRQRLRKKWMEVSYD